MTDRIAAIVRGPSAHFGSNGVLYPPGATVPADPGVDPAEVSEDNTRDVEVEYEARNGELRKKKVKARVNFRPVPDGATAEKKKSVDKLNVTEFLKKGDDDVTAAIAGGEVDDYLAAIEAGEKTSKGKKRPAIAKAIKERLEALNQ